MALIAELHDVAQVLSEYVTGELGIADVQAGPPRNANATTTPAVRFTLLFATPQPGHRNDRWEANPNGTQRPPPLSLSCFYLVTTSGAAEDDPIGAHNALGRVLQLFHDTPRLSLPLSDSASASPPAGYSDIGEGPLDVLQVPMSLDLIDKIWSSLEEQLQPWALFEVSPVQLSSLRADAPPPALVRPGGLTLDDLRIGRRLSVTRVAPHPVPARGRVRIDVKDAEPEGLIVGGVEVLASDASLTHFPGSGSLLLTLDDGGLEQLAAGSHPLVVTSGGMFSPRAGLDIAAPDAPAIEAPAVLRHDPSTALVLRGANLLGAVEALVWPDSGLAAPSDVHVLSLSSVTPNTVTIPGAGTPGGLGSVNFGPSAWRVAVRIGAHVFTPHVVLEFGA